MSCLVVSRGDCEFRGVTIIFLGTEEYNNTFIGDVEPTNMCIYIHRFHIIDEYTGCLAPPHATAMCHIYYSVNERTY
jgi:hypothetical protein